MTGKVWLIAISLLLKMTPVHALTNRLDGRVFSGQLVQRTSAGADEGTGQDNLIFSNGKLRSVTFDRLGFHESRYSVHSTRKGLVFEAIFDHDDGTRIFWKGTIQGLRAQASATWTRQGATAEEYEFSGILTHGKKP